MGLIRIDKLFHFEKGTLQSSKSVDGNFDFITASTNWKNHNEYTHECEALVFAAAASGSLGRTHYVNGKFISSDLCFIITPKDPVNLPVDLKFYHIIFNKFKEDIVKNTKAGTSKEAIGMKSFGSYKLPYFDIERQIEIKSKVVLLESSNEIINFELNNQLELLNKLRRQLFQDAIQGKLVEHPPNSESASLLLQKIKIQKEQLIKEKKLKKEKELRQINPKEIPFDIPDSWVWCRLGELALFSESGKSFKCTETPISDDNEWGVIKVSAVSWDSFLEAKNKLYSRSRPKDISAQIKAGDFIISRANTSQLVGKSVVVKSISKNLLLSDKTIRFKFSEFVLPEFINICNNAKHSRIYYGLMGTGSSPSMKNITREHMRNLMIPIPSLEEQYRIIKKLDILMQTCDALEASIKQSQQQNEQLLQQVLREALTKEVEQNKQLIEPAYIECVDDNQYKVLLLAAEIIWQLNQKQTLGHIKLQKLIYLCNRTQKMNLPVNFLKWAMGPYDPELQKYIDNTLVENEWFKYDEDSSLKYQPLKRAGCHKADFDKYFARDKTAINYLIQLFENAKSARIEIVATLFACWDELISNKQLVNDNSLLAEFYNWSEKKKKHTTEKVIDALRWMETQGIVPN